MKKTFLLIILAALISFNLAFTCLAADYGVGTATPSNLPTGSIAGTLGNIAGAALALAGSLFVFLMVYGGIIIMTAAGSQDKIGKGKNIIIWAIVGALILGASYAITQLVFNAIK